MIKDLAPFIAMLNHLPGVVDVVPTSTTKTDTGMAFTLSMNITDELYTHAYDQVASDDLARAREPPLRRWRSRGRCPHRCAQLVPRRLPAPGRGAGQLRDDTASVETQNVGLQAETTRLRKQAEDRDQLVADVRRR